MAKSIKSKNNLRCRKKTKRRTGARGPREEQSTGHWVPVPNGGRALADIANTLDLPVKQRCVVPNRAVRVHELRSQHLQALNTSSITGTAPVAAPLVSPPGVIVCRRPPPLAPSRNPRSTFTSTVHHTPTPTCHTLAGAPSCGPTAGRPPTLHIAGKVSGEQAARAAERLHPGRGAPGPGGLYAA